MKLYIQIAKNNIHVLVNKIKLWNEIQSKGQSSRSGELENNKSFEHLIYPITGFPSFSWSFSIACMLPEPLVPDGCLPKIWNYNGFEFTTK